MYLSAILDLYDRGIAAYRIGDSNNNPLVFDTFDDAVKYFFNCPLDGKQLKLWGNLIVYRFFVTWGLVVL